MKELELLLGCVRMPEERFITFGQTFSVDAMTPADRCITGLDKKGCFRGLMHPRQRFETLQEQINKRALLGNCNHCPCFFC